MSGRDAFLGSNYGGGGINGIQNCFDGLTLPCRFNAVDKNGGGTGKGELRVISWLSMRRMRRRTDRRESSWRIWRALHGIWSSKVNDSSSGNIEAMIVLSVHVT